MTWVCINIASTLQQNTCGGSNHRSYSLQGFHDSHKSVRDDNLCKQKSTTCVHSNRIITYTVNSCYLIITSRRCGVVAESLSFTQRSQAG